jgi:hypothetical protein
MSGNITRSLVVLFYKLYRQGQLNSDEWEFLRYEWFDFGDEKGFSLDF